MWRFIWFNYHANVVTGLNNGWVYHLREWVKRFVSMAFRPLLFIYLFRQWKKGGEFQSDWYQASSHPLLILRGYGAAVALSLRSKWSWVEPRPRHFGQWVSPASKFLFFFFFFESRRIKVFHKNIPFSSFYFFQDFNDDSRISALISFKIISFTYNNVFLILR